MGKRELVSLLIGCALLSGCATDSGSKVQTNKNSASMMASNSWIGRSSRELLKERGSPEQTMDATLLGGPPSEAWVYPPSSGDCMDTYVVSETSSTILNYYCR